ncbi:MAG: hypothetical protein HY584_01310 [Candidatus Omnitrophica bacterium]|nr:hypothetical protein [Candidatus Omnitrophota bacterium]
MELTARQTSNYGGLVSWSLGLVLALAITVDFLRGRIDIIGTYYLRNYLGYGHFALAYLFTWRMIRRKTESLMLSLLYVAGFLAVMGLYCAAQRWWLPVPVDILLNLTIFMVHHASNDVLFRAQAENGYQAFDWTLRRIGWVALAVGLIFVDRFRSPQNLFGAFAPLAPYAAAFWTAGWLIYGWRYCWRDPARSLPVGWLAAGAFGAWCALNTTGIPVFTSTERYGWFVIYHYVAWYVFYARKLADRSGGWEADTRPGKGLFGIWKYVTTVPKGFLWLVVVMNALIILLLIAGEPFARAAREATQLNFFYVHTIAHILFGIAVPRKRELAVQPQALAPAR